MSSLACVAASTAITFLFLYERTKMVVCRKVEKEPFGFFSLPPGKDVRERVMKAITPIFGSRAFADGKDVSIRCFGNLVVAYYCKPNLLAQNKTSLNGIELRIISLEKFSRAKESPSHFTVKINGEPVTLSLELAEAYRAFPRACLREQPLRRVHFPETYRDFSFRKSTCC
ncbi:MAG: hypothetical protein JSR76_00185 [Verrucomicrobia bacterium]|nr:hypothetical protein [Verrucomicrobiota bacterium]